MPQHPTPVDNSVWILTLPPANLKDSSISSELLNTALMMPDKLPCQSGFCREEKLVGYRRCLTCQGHGQRMSVTEQEGDALFFFFEGQARSLARD